MVYLCIIKTYKMEKKYTNNKAVLRSANFGHLLTNILEQKPVIKNYSKLEGTGIEFFSFVFSPGVKMLSYGITPQINAQFPKPDQDKHRVNLSGKEAFSFRVVDGVAKSPILNPEFIKYLEDDGKGHLVDKSFRLISEWVNKTQTDFKVIL